MSSLGTLSPVHVFWCARRYRVRTRRGFCPPAPAVGGPGHTYCERCEAPRPARAFHCAACGRCVLLRDHHCVWWDSVSRNLQIWVGADTQLWIIFPLTFYFWSEYPTPNSLFNVSDCKHTAATVVLPKSEKVSHNSKINSIHFAPKFPLLQSYLDSYFPLWHPGKSNFGTLVRLQHYLIPVAIADCSWHVKHNL